MADDPTAPPPRSSVPKTGHRITDPGDPSPIGHPEGSDFEPDPGTRYAYGLTDPGTGLGILGVRP